MAYHHVYMGLIEFCVCIVIEVFTQYPVPHILFAIASTYVSAKSKIIAKIMTDVVYLLLLFDLFPNSLKADVPDDNFRFLKFHTPLVADRMRWMYHTDEKFSLDIHARLLAQKVLTRSRTKKRIKAW